MTEQELQYLQEIEQHGADVGWVQQPTEDDVCSRPEPNKKVW